jgi:hypothetical protein
LPGAQRGVNGLKGLQCGSARGVGQSCALRGKA